MQRLANAWVLFLFTAMVVAQSGQMSGVEGVVKGFDGKPLAGATLVFVQGDTGDKYLMKTDRSGFYFRGNVRTGNYTVTVVNTAGEQLWRRHNIFVVLGSRGSTAFQNKYDIDLAQAKAQAEKEGRGLVEPAQLAIERQARAAAGAAERLKHNQFAAKLIAADVAEKNRDFALADNLLREAIEMQPDAGSLWARLALLRLNAGHAIRSTDATAAAHLYEDSVTASRKALELEPHTGSYLNNLADALARLDRLPEALSIYDQAIASGDGQAALYHSNRGIALTKSALREQNLELRRARLKQANSAFDAAVRLDPTLAEAFFQRAVNQMSFAETRKGKISVPGGTIESLQRYLELAPEGKYAEEARGLIAQLKK